MNKFVRKLIKDSIIFRNSTILSHYSTVQSRIEPLNDFNKPTSGHEKSNTNLTFSNQNSTLHSLFSHIRQNYRRMDKEDVIKTMDVLYKTAKKYDYKFSYKELIKVEGFEHMCRVIQKNAEHLNTYNTLRMLNIIVYFEVPVNTLLFQTLLQLISVTIKKLTVGQILITYFLLKNYEHLPFVQSIRLALVKAFKYQARAELYSESTNLLQALQFSSVVNDTETTRFIINILDQSSYYIPKSNAISILQALCALPYLRQCDKNILSKVYNILLENVESETVLGIESVLFLISKKCANSEMVFYHKNLIDSYCSAASTIPSSFTDKLRILSHLNKIRFCSTDFLDAMVKQCVEESFSLSKHSTIEVNQFIKGFAIGDYKLSNWNVMEEQLKDYVTNVDIPIQNMISNAYCLLSLNFYCPELLDTTFTLCNKLSNVIQDKKIISLALKLHGCLKFLYPKYEGTLLDESVLNKFTNSMMIPKDNNFPHLKESLENVVGGVEYMKENLRTKVGNFVDYVVVMQPDGSLMNTSNYNDIRFVEELTSFSDCIKILFFAYPEEAYCINKGNLFSTIDMQLKAIATQPGFNLSVINPNIWKKFSDTQAIKHLQEIIESNRSNTLK